MVLIHHGLDHGPLVHNGPHHGPHIHNGVDHGPLLRNGSASLKKNAVHESPIIF